MIPIFLKTYQLADSRKRNEVDFTDRFYIEGLRRVENSVNKWLNSNKYSCEVKVLLDNTDIEQVTNLYNELSIYDDDKFFIPLSTLNPKFEPNFKLPTSQRFNIVVLYDNQCYAYNKKETEKALQKFGQIAASLNYFRNFEKVEKNVLFKSVYEEWYVLLWQ